jgi:hypothetical protein
MFRFIAIGLEVQIVGNGVVFLSGGENDLHVEFAPSLLLNLKRWLLEGCKPLVLWLVGRR